MIVCITTGLLRILHYRPRISQRPLYRARMTTGEEDENMIALDDFALRQWREDYTSGTAITDIDPISFMARVNQFYHERKDIKEEPFKDGYAPFCKHLFMPNFVPSLRLPVMPITDDNRHLLLTRYDARTPKELPVLIRYFPKSAVNPPLASFLDLILYSREQIVKEHAATNQEPLPTSSNAAWRLISIKAQDVPYETPMTPITIMRNALISEGGSGVPIDREAYLASVKYWDSHATVI